MRRFHRRLMLGVIAVVKRPKWTLGGAGVVLVASILLAIGRLTISSDQNKLFNENVAFFRDYLRFNRDFPENEAIYVIVRAKGERPGSEKWVGIAQGIVDRLRPMRE